MQDTGKLILFLHIPKTAGTTVHRFFEMQFDSDQMLTLNTRGEDPVQEYQQLPPTRKHQLRVIKGHMAFGLHRRVDQPSIYVTLLRDPIDRLVSYYYYARFSDPNHFLHKEATEMSLEDFSKSMLTTEQDNVQVRLLAGRVNVPIGKLTGEDLQLAKKNLRNHFAVVGVQDNVKGFLTALSSRLGLRNVRVKPQNVTQGRPVLAKVSGEAKEIIRNCNRLDMELYEFVKQELEQGGLWYQPTRGWSTWWPFGRSRRQPPTAPPLPFPRKAA